MRKFRRNTVITDTSYEFKKFCGTTIGLGMARTSNGVGFITVTIKSNMEAREDRRLAVDVMRGRLDKALHQYKKGGRVNVKLTTLIPTIGMPKEKDADEANRT